MTNAHLQTAASNIRQAADDFKEKSAELRRDIDNAKRAANDRSKALRLEIDNLKRENGKADTAETTRIANNTRIQSIEKDISRQKQDTNRYERDILKEISGLEKQQQQFVNLAGGLESAA